MKIYAPVKDANGIYASVMFMNGVGETDDPVLIDWFRTHGYKIQLNDNEPLKVTSCPEKEVTTETNATPDFEAMSSGELRDWMRSNGYGGQIKNTKNKDKLLDILRG